MCVWQWALPGGDPLYSLTRTKPVVLAHTGDDRERVKMSGIF